MYNKNTINLLAKELKHNILSKEQVISLFRDKPEGWKDEVFNSNLKLVLSLAMKRNYLELDDYFQFGCLGLLTAIEKFDWTLGNTFTTYAVPWINQAIMRAEDDNSRTIRVPAYVSQFLSLIEKERDKGIENDNINMELIAGKLGIRYNESQEAFKTFKDAGSFDVAIEDNMKLSDAIADDEYVHKFEYNDLKKCLGILNAREYDIIKKRFFKDMTLEEIAQIYGITRERVRQIQMVCLDKLKDAMIEKGYNRSIIN